MNMDVIKKLAKSDVKVIYRIKGSSKAKDFKDVTVFPGSGKNLRIGKY